MKVTAPPIITLASSNPVAGVMSPAVSLGRLTSGMNITPELRPELKSSWTCYISSGNGDGADSDKSKSQPTAKQMKKKIAAAEKIADSYQRCLTLERFYFEWDDIAYACKALKRAIAASIQIESNKQHLDAVKRLTKSLWRVPDNQIPFIIDLLLTSTQRIKDSSTRADAISEMAQGVCGGELIESAVWRFFEGAHALLQKMEETGSRMMALASLADGIVFAWVCYSYENKAALVKYFEDLIAVAEKTDEKFFYRPFLLERIAFCLASVNLGDRALPLFEKLIDEARDLDEEDELLLGKTILFYASEAGVGDKLAARDNST